MTKRQCWYLREESDKADDKFARAAPPASAPAPASGGSRAGSRAGANDDLAQVDRRRARRMGLPAGPDRTESPARAEPQTVGAAPAPAVQNSPRAAMPNVLAPAPLSSMRWNDTPAASASSNSAPLQTAAAAAPPADQPLPQTEEVQQPAVDQITPAAAEPAPAKPTASLQMLLLVIAAALALAGITVSAIVRIGRMRARRAMRRKRRAMWDSAKTAKTLRRSSPPMFHDEDAGLRRTGGVQPHDAHAQGAAARSTGARTRPAGACPSGERPRRSGHARPRTRSRAHPRTGNSRLRKCWPGSPAARRPNRSGSGGYFSSWRCSLRTNSVRPVRRSRLSRSALRIDCTSANASSTLWLTTI